MSLKEDDLISCSTYPLDTVNTAEAFSGNIPSRFQAYVQRPVGDTSHYMASVQGREKHTSVSLGGPPKDEESQTNTAGPYLAGFVIGWFTWIFGLLLCFFTGKSQRSASFRKGLIVGSISVSIPFMFFLTFLIIAFIRWNAFLDKFPFGLKRQIIEKLLNI